MTRATKLSRFLPSLLSFPTASPAISPDRDSRRRVQPLQGHGIYHCTSDTGAYGTALPGRTSLHHDAKHQKSWSFLEICDDRTPSCEPIEQWKYFAITLVMATWMRTLEQKFIIDQLYFCPHQFSGASHREASRNEHLCIWYFITAPYGHPSFPSITVLQQSTGAPSPFLRHLS